ATASDKPDAVSASSAAQIRNVGQLTSLTNNAGNNLSQVTFTAPVPSGFTFVKDTLGKCTVAAGQVTCGYGQLPDGQTVADTLVFRTPVLSLGSEQTSTFAGTWCWAGCVAHAPGATRVDSVDVSETTTVVAASGFDATYLVAGEEAALTTGASVGDTNTLGG